MRSIVLPRLYSLFFLLPNLLEFHIQSSRFRVVVVIDMALVTTVVPYLILRGLGKLWIRSFGVSSFVASGFISQTFSPFFFAFVGRPPFKLLLPLSGLGLIPAIAFRACYDYQLLWIMALTPLCLSWLELNPAPGLVLDCSFRWSSILMTSSCPPSYDCQILRNTDRMDLQT